MGPFNVLGQFCHGQEWAHPLSSAAFLMNNNGPIQCHRQHVSGVTMGLPMIFGSIILQSKWPHPIISTTFIRWPMCKLQQFTEWADVGFPELLDKLSH